MIKNRISFREREIFLPSLFYYNTTFDREGNMFITSDFELLEYDVIMINRSYVKDNEMEDVIKILKISIPNRLVLYRPKQQHKNERVPSLTF